MPAPNISMHFYGSPVGFCNSTKYLGITIDAELSLMRKKKFMVASVRLAWNTHNVLYWHLAVAIFLPNLKTQTLHLKDVRNNKEVKICNAVPRVFQRLSQN